MKYLNCGNYAFQLSEAGKGQRISRSTVSLQKFSIRSRNLRPAFIVGISLEIMQ